MVKDSQKKIIDEIKNLYIPSLEKYLSSKFGVDKITYTCDICNVFVANSKKALSSHKRNKDCKSKVHNMSCFNIELDNNDIIGNMPTPLKKTKKQTKQNKTNNC